MKKYMMLLCLAVTCLVFTSACGNKSADVKLISEVEEESMKNALAPPSESLEMESAEDIVFMEEEMKSFGDKVKAAVASKDMNALEVLLAYPTYIGVDGGVIINSTEEFLALDEEKIFQKNLLDAVAAVDTSALSATEAGVIMGDGTPNVIFQVLEGSCFGITGINE